MLGGDSAGATEVVKEAGLGEEVMVVETDWVAVLAVE